MRKLTLGSLFSGSGGFELAGKLCGIRPIWASEVAPFPIRVTTKRLPEVKHVGDITKIDGSKIEPVDIISAGFCCQDVSAAGLRAGLYGARTGLFFEIIRIIKEMRCSTNGMYPRYLVAENVLGLFSSGNGEHFRTVLEEILRIRNEEAVVPMPQDGKWANAGVIVGDGYSLAFRVLAAEHFGVAQRRHRIFIVADFDSECAGEILFEREGVSRRLTSDSPAWQGAAGDITAGAGTAIGFEPGAIRRLGGHAWLEQTGTLRADMGDNQAAVATRINRAYGICSDRSHAMLSDNPNSGIYAADTARTLDGNGGRCDCQQGGIAVVTYFMTVGGYPDVSKEQAGTLMARDYKDPPIINTQTEHMEYAVRRLLPSECAKLMGFPPWWCSELETPDPTEEEIDWWYEVFETYRKAIGKSTRPRTRAQVKKWLQNPYTETAEYSMWGNGIVLTCAEFVMAGIVEKYAKNIENI